MLSFIRCRCRITHSRISFNSVEGPGLGGHAASASIQLAQVLTDQLVAANPVNIVKTTDVTILRVEGLAAPGSKDTEMEKAIAGTSVPEAN